MDARRYLWAALLICSLQRSSAVDTIYTTCEELSAQGSIEVSIFEADNQELIDANPEQYTDRIGLAVTEGVTIRFSTESDGLKYPASEYFQFVEAVRRDGIKGSEWFIQLIRPIDRDSGTTVLEYPSFCSEQLTAFQLILKVVILDRNDNSPVFSPRNYQVTVSEDYPIGSNLIYVTATDIDAGVNKNINYELQYLSSQPQPDRCQFTISQPSSGVISVAGSLSGVGNLYCSFIVIASDSGSPPRSGTAQVGITIQEVDNLGPVFVYPNCVQDDRGNCIYPVYTTTIPISWTGKLTLYSVPVGTSESLLLARDEDQSSPLTFYIANGDAYKDYFTVDTKETSDGLYKGEITLDTPLADTANNFILELLVQETASTGLMATALIYVTVVTSVADTTPAITTPAVITQNTETNPAPSTDSLNVAAIALGIVVAILLLIILMLIVYIVRKRSKSKEDDPYTHLSANRAPSRTYNVISNEPKGDNSKESNGRTNEAATYELEKNPNDSRKLTSTPSGDYDVPEAAYVEIIG